MQVVDNRSIIIVNRDSGPVVVYASNIQTTKYIKPVFVKNQLLLGSPRLVESV